jgi:glycerophosphoryl diester phosphodiesterase
MPMRTRACCTAIFVAIVVAPPAGAFDLQGHRGARGLAPENTLAAFKRALDIGVTTIETDVGVTRDGIVVISHDRRLNPALTRDPAGKWLASPGPTLRTLTLAELKTYDVGRLDPASSYAKSWAQQAPADGERIPALTELFDLMRASGRPVRLNIETKLSPNAPDETVDPNAFARAVVDTVRGAGFAAGTTVQSFDWRTLIEVKRLAPDIATACLTQEGGNGDTVKPDASGGSPWHAGLKLAQHGDSLPRLVKAAGCDIWSPSWRAVSRERIKEAHALGLKVLPWTVNEPADMEMLVDAGVDGLITDYPDRLRSVLAARGKPLP